MAKYFYQDGLDLREGSIEIPPTSRPDFDSCHVFAFPKSGSVLLNHIVEVLMQESGVPFINIPNHCHQKGISFDAILFDRNSFAPKGYCYAGYRDAPSALRGCLSKLPGRKILMVRDPRDMLVSLFYSVKSSHWFPEDGTDQFFHKLRPLRASAELAIDAFCASNTNVYVNALNNYSDLLDDSSAKIVRYEDVIFSKVQLARLICDWFSLRFSSDRLTELVAPFDVTCREEKPNAHVRQVEPGDHKRKLQASTIEFLNAVFAGFIRRFGYAT